MFFKLKICLLIFIGLYSCERSSIEWKVEIKERGDGWPYSAKFVNQSDSSIYTTLSIYNINNAEEIDSIWNVQRVLNSNYPIDFREKLGEEYIVNEFGSAYNCFCRKENKCDMLFQYLKDKINNTNSQSFMLLLYNSDNIFVEN